MLVNTVTNCEDLANKQDGVRALVCTVLTCLREKSKNFIWNCWILMQAAPLLKHLSVDHSTGAEPNSKSKTLLSQKFPQGGAEQSYRAHMLELSTSTQVIGKQAMVSILSFALNQLIIYLKHSPKRFWSILLLWKPIQLGNKSVFFLWFICWSNQFA